MTRRWVAAAIAVVALVAAGWVAWRFATHDRSGAALSVSTAASESPVAGPAQTVETIDTGATALPTGGTPMAQRIAVLGLLNKRNGESRELTLKPGQAVRVGDVIVRLRACEKTAPWEDDPLTGAFVQLDVRGADQHWRRVFSGWLYKERPALNVVQHRIYDVWPKSCAMSWPASGPDTTPLDTIEGNRSSAVKSPAAKAPVEAPAPAAEAPTTPSNAPVSNAT